MTRVTTAIVGALVLAACGAIACGRPSPARSTIADTQRASFRGPGALITAPAPCPEGDASSAAELSVVTGRMLAIADEGLSSIEDALDAARRDRDVVWAVCLDEKLDRLREIRGAAVSHATTPTDDRGDVEHRVATARALCEEARGVVNEATQCVSGAPE